MRAEAFVGAALLASLACGRTSSSSERAAGSADTAPRVVLHVDEQVVVTATLDATHPLELALLVPASVGPAAWRDVVARASGDRMAIVQRPSERYAGQHALLDVVGGQARFGMYRTPDPALPPEVRELARAPSVSLVGVTDVFVRTRERDAVASGEDPSFTITVGDREVRRWTRTALAAGAQVSAPGLGERGEGWDVAALAQREVGSAPLRALRLVGRDVPPIVLDAQQLADRLVLLKFNRRGQARVRMWSRHARRAQLGDVVDLVGVEPIVR